MTEPAGGGPPPDGPGYWEQQASVQQQPGYPGYYHPYVPTPPVHPLATTSLVLGVISVVTAMFCLVTVLLAPVAVVLALVAMRAIRQAPQQWSGMGLAIAGLVTGAVVTVGSIALAVVIWAMFAPYF
jgi:hypothetical protein